MVISIRNANLSAGAISEDRLVRARLPADRERQTFFDPDVLNSSRGYEIGELWQRRRQTKSGARRSRAASISRRVAPDRSVEPLGCREVTLLRLALLPPSSVAADDGVSPTPRPRKPRCWEDGGAFLSCIYIYIRPASWNKSIAGGAGGRQDCSPAVSHH